MGFHKEVSIRCGMLLGFEARKEIKAFTIFEEYKGESLWIKYII
jgi:hypothetical protein